MDLFNSNCYDIFKDEKTRKKIMKLDAIACKRSRAVENRIKVAKSAIENNDMKTFCEVMNVDTKLFSKELESLPEDERKVALEDARQSAKEQQERLFLAQLQQSKSTYLVCFDNGYNYGHVSALELYNFQKLKMQYNQIINDREGYLQTLQREQFNRAIINTEEITKAHKIKLMETEPYLNEIIKAAQLFTMPFNREIEKIIDETTNTVVKI